MSLVNADYDTDSDLEDTEAMAPASEEPALTSEELVRSILEQLVFDTVTAREEARMTEYRTANKRSHHATMEVYNSEDSDEDSSSEEGSESGSDSDAVSDDSEGSEADSEEEEDSEEDKKKKALTERKKRQPRTKNELGDLPPIEDLYITVPESQAVKIGTISTIVDELVVVKAGRDTPAIDIDSVLFLDTGSKPLGRVFDVFGPVVEPYYSVRFNSSEHVAAKEVTVGLDVWYAPKTEHTSFIFVDQLRRLKGTDSSWKHDEETPIKFMEFSDDEEEQRVKREYRERKQRERAEACGDQIPCGGKRSKEQHQQGQAAFYRRQRRHNPHDQGPIRWNSAHTSAGHHYAHHGHNNPLYFGGSGAHRGGPPTAQRFTSRPPPPYLFSAPPPGPQAPPQGGYHQYPAQPGPSNDNRLPNPFSGQGMFGQPPSQVFYSNQAFRYPPPPPPPPQ